MFNFNGKHQNPTFELPPEMPEEQAQSTQPPQQVSHEAIMLQRMTECLMQRNRGDAALVMQFRDDLKTSRNAMIEQVCSEMEAQIAEWQMVVKALRAKIQ